MAATGLTSAEDIGRTIKLLLEEKGISNGTPGELVEKYVRKDLRAFANKKSDIFNITFDIRGLLSFRLLQGGQIHIGGSGVVLQVVNPHAPNIRYGLKFLKPTFLDIPEHRDRLFTDSKKEFLRHVPLLDNNVARIFGTPERPLMEQRPEGQPSSFEPILMEWIEGARPLSKYLLQSFQKDHTSFLERMIDIMIQCFSALAYVHNHDIIHWDIKSDNFLVNDSNTAKLVDIGNARLLTDSDRGDIALTTIGNFPSGLDDFVVEQEGPLDSSKRTRIDLRGDWSWDAPWLDMWMLAREFMEFIKEESEPYALSALNGEQLEADTRIAILKKISTHEADEKQFVLRCLRLILRRILVASRPNENSYYRHASEVVSDLLKIRPAFGDAQDVRELSAVPQSILRIPVSGNVPFTERVARLYDSRLLQRLRGHFQLGPTYQVFPGATHRRSEHAAGVLCVTCDYIRALFADRSNPFWRLTITKDDVEALLVAALVHDVGHIAYGHFLEEMEGFLRRRTHEDYAVSLLDPGRANSCFDEKNLAEDREILASAVFEDVSRLDPALVDSFLLKIANILRPGTEMKEALWGTNKHDELTLSQAIYDRTKCDAIKFFIMHSILDSAIDADKLDYLLRDAYHCGIKYADGIDTDRFFQSLTVVSDLARLKATTKLENWPAPKDPSIAVSLKGILPLESILIARDQLFRSVYWHHTVRSLTAMLQYAVAEFVGAGVSDSRAPPSSAGTTNDEILRRIDELILEFRSQNDGDAIVWLRKEIGTRVKQIPLRNRLREICDCLLGDRRYLYKEIFALTYEQRPSTDAKTDPSDIYIALSKWSQRANDAGSALEFLQMIRTKRKEITEKMSEAGIELKDGDILIDVPPAGRDQVDNIFVDFGDVIRSIHEVSYMGHAVRYSFAYWTRSLRIFIAPDALEKYEKRGVTRGRLREHCSQILQQLVRAENPQQDFPF
jgi:HD superfamily phosphohydrolase